MILWTFFTIFCIYKLIFYCKTFIFSKLIIFFAFINEYIYWYFSLIFCRFYLIFSWYSFILHSVIVYWIKQQQFFCSAGYYRDIITFVLCVSKLCPGHTSAESFYFPEKVFAIPERSEKRLFVSCEFQFTGDFTRMRRAM